MSSSRMALLLSNLGLSKACDVEFDNHKLKLAENYIVFEASQSLNSHSILQKKKSSCMTSFKLGV